MVSKIAIQKKSNDLSLTLVVAMTSNYIIGNQGRLPWNLPDDLRLFRKLTLGGTLIMGRKTFESLPVPLDGRHNLVVGVATNEASGCDCFSSPDDALARARVLARPIFIIGGRQIYQATLPLCTRMIISWVDADIDGDTLFPNVEWSEWMMEHEEQHTGFRRCIYSRQLFP